MAKLVAVAAAAACAVCLHSHDAVAQEPLTPGGDVTAEEAAVLPPVVVSSPNEPIARRAKTRVKASSAKAKATGAAQQTTAEDDGADVGVNASDLPGSGIGPASGGPAIATGIFSLGQLDMIGGSTITNEAMWTYNKKTLNQAVNILPGVSSTNSGGSRNEGDIFVRGFNRLQVPLSIDGVRVYLPADNRIDMNRFITDDLAEVQVAKGYVSVLNGPGAMGGSINLVSRKPTKEIELEGRAGLVVNGDIDDLNSWNSYAYAGTRQRGWYAQVSGNIVSQDHFNLSHDFTPANSSTLGYVSGFPYEDGGNRDNSDFRDWRINAKVGLTPNVTDEYSINYTVQNGEKSAPLHTNRQIVQGYFLGNTVRYWDWPSWDTSTLSWLSKTKLGDASYVKTNAFYNTFQNSISFYPNGTYTNPFTDSPYDDYSYGGFVEMGTDLIPMNTLKGAIHYRRDAHNEQDINYDYTTDPRTVTLGDPKRRSEETWSFAVENTFHATRYLDIVAGGSFDTNEVLSLEPDRAKPTDPNPLAKPYADAWNWQTAAIYSYSNTGKVHADVSSRTRFPTLFDRYSTRFGSRTENPNLSPERATNYELGLSDEVFRNVHVSTAVFYADIEDSIQNAFTAANGNNSIVGYNADGHNYGFELSIDWDVMPTLRVGGNYTYLERNLNFAGAAFNLDPLATPQATQAAQAAVAASQIEGTPRHKAFVYLAWRATNQLTLTPSLELASDRTALVTSCASTLVANQIPPAAGSAANGNCGKASGFTGKPSYVNIGSYALVNFQAEYAFNDNTSMTIGGINLLDENYSFAEGFPEPGRQFFANLRARF
jgi:iron complex outermembrane receptor protein